MDLRNLEVLVFWMKVALAFEGLTDLTLELKSMLTPKALVFRPVQTIWEEGFP